MVGDSRLQIAELIMPVGWDMEKLTSLLPVQMAEKIISWLGKLRSGKDILVWQLTSNGLFSTKSAWQII